MNMPYHLLLIGMGIGVVYIMGSLLVYLGILSKNLHRKIWNYTLLAVFLGCVVLGLLLAIQISYKLDWPFISSALKWHVNLGIAMSLVAAIHIFWHLRYFTGSSHRIHKKISQNECSTLVTTHELGIMAFAAGLASISFQILILRQVTKVFQGNEFTQTWVIGLWMLLTGLGSVLGRKAKLGSDVFTVISRLIIFQCIAAVIVTFSIGYIKNLFFPVGVLSPPIATIAISTFLLIPVAVPAGIAYALMVSRFNAEDPCYARVYSMESLGSMAGGILVSLIIIHFLTVYQSVLVIGGIATLIISVIRPGKGITTVPLMFFLVMAVFMAAKADRLIEQNIMHGQRVLAVKESPYGSITVTDYGGQLNFFENGLLLFGTGNPVAAEEGVHYAMLQRSNPSEILLVSGGYAGLTAELLKYKNAHVDYVEVNGPLLKLCEKHAPLPENQRVRFIRDDGRRYLAETSKRYDVIIVALPEPVSLQLNRYYTVEFMKTVRSHLLSNGVACFNLPPVGNYASPERQRAISSVYNTLTAVFANVEVVPGERDYLLASDGEIRIDISRLAVERGMAGLNTYVNPDFIDDDYLASRNRFFHASILSDAMPDTDNHPYPVFLFTMSYLGQFGSNHLVWMLVGLAVVLLPVFFLGKPLRGMFLAGFSGASAEMIIILMFQVLFGFLYAGIGLIVALFMAGLAVGAYVLPRFIRLSVGSLTIAMAGYFALIPLIWMLRDVAAVWLLLLVISLFTLIPSVLVGYQYVLWTSAVADRANPAAMSYSADLWGSTLGVVVVTLALIPLLGVVQTAAVLAALNLAGRLLIQPRNR